MRFQNIFVINKNILREILILAFPVILSNISRVFMMLTDTAMVANLGKNSIAAVGIGGVICWSFIAISISLRTATQSVTARRLGQEKLYECGLAMRNGQLLALCIGLPLSIGGYFLTKPIVYFFITDMNVVSLCIDYTKILFLSIYFTYANFVFVGFFTGIERTTLLLKITIISNLINIYLNAGLIYGSNNVIRFFESIEIFDMTYLSYLWKIISFPELGVKGAALGTLIATLFTFFYYIYHLFNKNIQKIFGTLKGTLVNKAMLIKQVQVAYPQAIEEFLGAFAWALFFKIIAMIGTVELAAFHIINNIFHLGFMPAIGIGQACSTLVGKYLGEKNEEKALISIIEATRCSLILMGIIGTTFMLFPEYIFNLFTTESNLLNYGILGLQISGIILFFDAFGLTIWFALSGAGDTLYPAIASVLLTWLFYVPGSYLTGIILDMGFYAPLLCISTHVALFAIMMVLRVISGKWKYHQI